MRYCLKLEPIPIGDIQTKINYFGLIFKLNINDSNNNPRLLMYIYGSLLITVEWTNDQLNAEIMKIVHRMHNYFIHNFTPHNPHYTAQILVSHNGSNVQQCTLVKQNTANNGFIADNWIHLYNFLTNFSTPNAQVNTFARTKWIHEYMYLLWH